METIKILEYFRVVFLSPWYNAFTEAFHKFPKTGRNIYLDIDLQIFSHNQSIEYSHLSNVDFCNQSTYTHPDDWFLVVWLGDILILFVHTVQSTGSVCKHTAAGKKLARRVAAVNRLADCCPRQPGVRENDSPLQGGLVWPRKCSDFSLDSCLTWTIPGSHRGQAESVLRGGGPGSPGRDHTWPPAWTGTPGLAMDSRIWASVWMSYRKSIAGRQKS